MVANDSRRTSSNRKPAAINDLHATYGLAMAEGSQLRQNIDGSFLGIVIARVFAPRR